MESIDKINSFIESEILNGNYDITVEMGNYYNTSYTPNIIVKRSINSITFRQEDPNKTYEFHIGIEDRLTDTNIIIENLNMNSKENIGINFRGNRYSKYKSKLLFSGINKIKSENFIAIDVANNSAVIIEGRDENSLLEAYGGNDGRRAFAAIGNTIISEYGGHLILSGNGTIKAYGGNGGDGKATPTSNKEGINGAHAIGFTTTTADPTSIEIKDNINVKAYGGYGQSINYDHEGIIYESASGGNGGVGISSGICTSIVKTSYGSLDVYGGNGGDSLAEFTWLKSGEGGSAIEIDSGQVTISLNSNLNGGNGGNGGDGGNGGRCIFTSNKSQIACCKNDYIKVKDINLSSGCGGLGVAGLDLIDFRINGGNGGNGAAIIDAGSKDTVVIIDSVRGVRGSGGEGGSPCDYFSQNKDDINGVGNGGDSGLYIAGERVLYEEKGYGWLHITPAYAGMPGKECFDLKGHSGKLLPPIMIINNIKSKICFNNLNLAQNLLFPNNSKPINFIQQFNYQLNLQDIQLQNRYDSSRDIIYGNITLQLLAEIITYEYRNKNIAVFSN